MTQDMKVVYVYDDFSSNCPLLMGRLYVSIIRGSESYSFEYDNEWLRTSGINMALDPFLLPYAGRHYPRDKNIFGLFADSSPDRWGRILMNKRERLKAERRA